MRVCQRDVYVAADGTEFDDKDDCIAYESTLEPVIKTTMYAHGSKDSNWDRGESLGLSGNALREFSYSLYEVKFSVEVNRKTGHAMCTHVNDVKLVEPVRI